MILAHLLAGFIIQPSQLLSISYLHVSNPDWPPRSTLTSNSKLHTWACDTATARTEHTKGYSVSSAVSQVQALTITNLPANISPRSIMSQSNEKTAVTAVDLSDYLTARNRQRGMSQTAIQQPHVPNHYRIEFGDIVASLKKRIQNRSHVGSMLSIRFGRISIRNTMQLCNSACNLSSHGDILGALFGSLDILCFLRLEME